jgi:hypothetical protein
MPTQFLRQNNKEIQILNSPSKSETRLYDHETKPFTFALVSMRAELDNRECTVHLVSVYKIKFVILCPMDVGI